MIVLEQCGIAILDGDASGPGLGHWLSPVALVLIPLVLAIPVFAHGCHTGDHDDEAHYAPRSHDAEPAR